MPKTVQARFQQYMNQEIPDVQASFRKSRGTRDQIANIHWSIGKARQFQETIYLCFIGYAKALDCLVQKKSGKFLKRWEYQTHLACLLRNLYAGQEAAELDTDWFQIGKGVCQGCILSPLCYAYLTYMQSTWCKMPGWMKHKLESRLPGEISITSDMQMTLPLWQKAKKN